MKTYFINEKDLKRLVEIAWTSGFDFCKETAAVTEKVLLHAKCEDVMFNEDPTEHYKQFWRAEEDAMRYLRGTKREIPENGKD